MDPERRGDDVLPAVRAVSTTALPEVMAALVSLATAALPGVLVVDGPPTQFADEQHRQQTLYLGWGLEDGAVQSEWGDEGLRRAESETLTLICAADSWTSSLDYAAARVSLVGMLRSLSAALEANPTLNGLVTEVELGDRALYDWRPDSGGSGVRASAAFTLVARKL